MDAKTNMQRVLNRIQDAVRHTLQSESIAANVDRSQIPSMGAHLSQSNFHYDWRLIIGISLLLTFPITYLMTSLKSSIAIREKRLWREPPIMPYWIPYLGNLLPLLWDPSEFLSKIP